MSYCRFSSDDYQCDVYCYEDSSGGFTTHVAGNRPLLDGTLPPVAPFSDTAAWIERHEKVMRWVKTADRTKIGLPFDGEGFNDPTASGCADRLEWLRGLGYNVPQYAIDALREEAAEDSSHA